MTIDELIERLAAVYRSGRRYAFVQHAHQALAQVPHAPQLALLTLRALAEMGLGSAARELLAMRGDIAATGSDVDELKSAAGRLPDGTVDWAAIRPRFDKNVAALLAVRPELRSLVRALPDSDGSVQLHRTIDGRHYVSRSGGEGRLREWLAPLSLDAISENAPIPEHGTLGPTVVVGVRLGGVMQRVLANTDKIYLAYGHPVFLIEPDLLHFAAWLHTADHAALLSEERVHVFVGPDAVDQLAQTLEATPDLPAPTHFVNLRGDAGLAGEIEARIERVCSARSAEHDELRAVIEERYRGRDAAYWAARYGEPDVALGVTSRSTTVLQYSMRDTLDALRRLGWRTEMVIEEKDHHQISPISISRRILDTDPSLIVLLDHLRYENTFLPSGVPVLTWIQDPLPNLLCERAGASIGPLDFVCGYYRDRCTEEFGYPPERFVSTVIPVSERVFHDAPLDPEGQARYGCDISFVSNASMPVEEFIRSALPAYPTAYQTILEKLAVRAPTIGDDALNVQAAHAAIDLVRSVAAEQGVALEADHVDHIAINFVYRIYDWGRRHQALEWVGDWARRTGRSFRIYGRGWEEHPTLAEFAAGVLEHGEPLRCANRGSKLALQLASSGFRHQRSCELLASGTLPLTRYCATNFDFLPVAEYVRRRDAGEAVYKDTLIFPRLERVVFDTAAEFEALAEGYLSDEAYRQEVIADLRAVVLRDHTYTAVLREVTGHMREQLDASAQRADVLLATREIGGA